MENWVEWIQQRFADKDLFQIIDERATKSNCYDIIVKSAKPDITTRICFSFFNKDDETALYDIQFAGGNIDEKVNTWCSHFTVDPMYEPEVSSDNGKFLHTSLFCDRGFISRLEKEWLVIPLKHGWYEESYFIGKEIIYSRMKINQLNTRSWSLKENYFLETSLKAWLNLIFRFKLKKETHHFKPMVI